MNYDFGVIEYLRSMPQKNAFVLKKGVTELPR